MDTYPYRRSSRTMANNSSSPAMSMLKKAWEFVKTFSDWILLIVGEVLAQFIGGRKPFEQVFSVLDPSISFPKAVHEKVTDIMLYVYCFAVPAAIVLIVNLVFGPGKFARRLSLVNWSLLGVATSVVFAQLFTEVIKFMVGRPRPDLLSRCHVDTARAQAAITSTAITLFNSTICTSTDTSTLNDGFRSFPSGHSSQSFAGLTFLALWLAGRLRLFVPHSPHGKHIYAYTISAAPLLLASFVASSRVSDFRHRLSDVTAGTILGIFFGVLGYRYYFPWVSSSSAGTPWMIIRQEEGEGINHRGEPLLPTVYATDIPPTTGHTRSPTPYSETAHESSGNPMELHSLPQGGYSTLLQPPSNGH